MSKKVIAIDIDDVLAANAAGFVAYSNKRWGTRLTPEDYTEHWGEMWRVDHDEANKRSLELHHLGVFRNYAHDDTALPVLQELKRQYDLIVLTSRRVLVKDLTEEWINKHYKGVFSGIYFAGIYDGGHHDGVWKATKAEMLQELNASYLIDDQTKHCFAAAKIGVQGVLFGDYPWNRTDELPSNVTRCKDWTAVRDFFAREQ